MIWLLRLHLPDNKHRNEQRQQASDDQPEVLNHCSNDRIAMALLSDLATILFQLIMACVNGRLLLVELGCQFLLGCDQLTTSFGIAFDQFLRGFSELVAFFDDCLRTDQPCDRFA